MAREFEPRRGPALDNEMRTDATRGDLRMDPATRNGTGMGTLGIMLAIGVALAVGLMFWSMRDGTNNAASNVTPGVTTGMSSATPSPSNPPPAPGSTGQGESNSTR
jgi:hypothetical protein